VIQKHDKVIVIGGTAWQVELLARRYGLENLEHFNPPMGFIHDFGALEACLRFIEAHSPFRFCFIAVGCPQQEQVAQRLKARGRASGLALCIGSSINFLTGTEQRAPRWMRDLGMEWLYRAIRNPVRLGRRYFVRGPYIFPLLQRFTFWLRRPRAARADFPDSP
jgi:UDP-N-acetyl-D-mannosaminuronic acid transferase (WecB/TagA/CpsF family)